MQLPLKSAYTDNGSTQKCQLNKQNGAHEPPNVLNG